MISQPLQQLIKSLSQKPILSDWSDYDGPRFVTNKITISVGSFYERMRYAVDYKEEHMLRLAAIERILRRVIFFTSTEEKGKAVLEELVQARYIENNTVPEMFADDIQNIINKYRRLDNQIDGDSGILWSYASIEIEKHLFPAEIDERTFTAMFQSIVEYVLPKETNILTPETFHLYVYIACRRVLLRESYSTLSYSLFRIMVPEWRTQLDIDEESIKKIATRFPTLQREIQQLMSNPLQWKITGRIKNESIYFSIFNNIVRKFGTRSGEIFDDPQRLRSTITSLLEQIYNTHKAKVSQSGTRVIIYILITKVVLGISVEFPYEFFVLQHINYLALGINIIFFPILLIFMTKTVRYPGAENTDAIVKKMQTLVEGGPQEIQYISLKPKSNIQKFGHALFAGTFFLFTFGIIIYLLNLLKFNPVSVAIFLLFLSIVTYMGLRIRHKAREWTIETEDESFTGLLWFLCVLPITRTGRWVSDQLSTINIFVFFMDFILETPFKIILGSFDSFVSYVKETRRDGV